MCTLLAPMADGSPHSARANHAPPNAAVAPATNFVFVTATTVGGADVFAAHP